MKVIEHFELKYTYDDVTYIKDFYTWNKLQHYLRWLKKYVDLDCYTITLLKG